MEIKVKLSDELRKIIFELGFSGNSEFIEEAVREKILELKKQKFFEISDEVLSGLKSNNINQKDILDNLEKRE